MKSGIYTWLCALTVAFGGYMWGYEVGSINGVKEMKDFRRTFNISYTSVTVTSSLTNETVSAQCSSEDDLETSALLGSIVSALQLGALLGALLSGPLSDLAGRKVTVIIGALLCAIGGAMQASSFYLWMLFLGRIASGMGIGVLLQISPLYIAEIAPREKRGVMVAFVNTSSTVGALVGTIINFAIKEIPFGWRITLSLRFLSGLALAVCALLLPESPRFLVRKHKDPKALKVLNKIHQDNIKAQNELIEIQSSLRHSSHENIQRTLNYLSSKSVLQRLFIGISLTLVTMGLGVAIIVMYSVSIFCKVGVDGYVGTIVLMVFNFGAQIFGVIIISKCGRKPLLLLGTMVMGGALVVAATLIRAVDLEGNSDLSVERTVAGYFVIALVTLFVSANTATISTILHIVLSEIYPIRIRGISAALSQIGFWGGVLLLGEVGPVFLSSPLKTSGTFYLLGGMCFLASLYVLLLIPETKDKSLEDIEELFSEPWRKRANLFYYLRCGCFWYGMSGMCKKSLVRVETADSAEEEREELREPLDQVSLSSADSVDHQEKSETNF